MTLTSYTTQNTNFAGSTSRFPRSTEMQTMHEALAREHMRDLRDQEHAAALSRSLASASRWHRLERRSRAASRRHAQRAARVARTSAVAD
jgi:hypothetical protein